MTTADEDRAWLEHVRTLRRKKLIFNEDEIWVLYRLIVAERSSDTPTLLPDLPPELNYAMGMALAKLSEAHLDLTALPDPGGMSADGTNDDTKHDEGA